MCRQERREERSELREEPGEQAGAGGRPGSAVGTGRQRRTSQQTSSSRGRKESRGTTFTPPLSDRAGEKGTVRATARQGLGEDAMGAICESEQDVGSLEGLLLKRHVGFLFCVTYQHTFWVSRPHAFLLSPFFWARSPGTAWRDSLPREGPKGPEPTR